MYLISINIRRNNLGEEVRAHGSSLKVNVQSSRVVIGH